MLRTVSNCTKERGRNCEQPNKIKLGKDNLNNLKIRPVITGADL